MGELGGTDTGSRGERHYYSSQPERTANKAASINNCRVSCSDDVGTLDIQQLQPRGSLSVRAQEKRSAIQYSVEKGRTGTLGWQH